METRIQGIVDINDDKKDIYVTIGGERWMTLHEPLYLQMKTSYEELRNNPTLILETVATAGLMLALELQGKSK